ncbi:hypothetical protein AALP_AA7G032500 [Arabis alpina]|uniref:Pentacotripeptide-repeat region of PRORP domain-containing protein n=1 Tax=Arabis alpina TaxID=50452 RepID=A0A087GFM7_ARAAL|nr:hypothetical protein AALP_AA7G032500 [Arabis alpina]
MKPPKPSIFSGHRKPSQNRPVVYGGLFSNRQSLSILPPKSQPNQNTPFNLQKWDPESNPSPKPPPSSSSISAATERLSPIARLAVYDDFKEDELVEDCVTFMILVKGLCKAGRIKEMFEILERMRGELCKPDVFAYTAMIKSLVSVGNIDGSLRVWDEMKGDEVKPDVMAYGTLILGLCKDGRVERGYELFMEMKEKEILIDREIYRVLIEGFVADGKVRDACDLWKDLVDSGYIADLGIYNAVIKGLCSVKQVDKAYKLFGIAIEEELEPDFETLCPIMVAYVVMKRLSDFSNLVQRIGESGYPVADYLSQFFRLLCDDEEKRTMALDVFDVVKSKGHGSVSVYNILMESLYKMGDVQKSLSLFYEMRDCGFKPDSSSYSIAICCFVEKGEVQEACSCHEKIIEMSCVPSIAAYLSLTRGLSQIGEIDAVMILVRECLGNVESGPMEFKYALRVCHVCKGNNAEKVMEVLDEMNKEGVSISEVIYCAIISGMCKHGTIKAGREVFAELRKRKVMTEADMVVYDEMLVEQTKKKTADLVLSGIKFFGLESKLRAKGCRILDN